MSERLPCARYLGFLAEGVFWGESGWLVMPYRISSCRASSLHVGQSYGCQSFIAVGLFVTCGDADLMRRMLLAYGYAIAELDGLPQQLMAYALLHVQLQPPVVPAGAACRRGQHLRSIGAAVVWLLKGMTV